MAPHHKGEDLQELAMLARLIQETATTTDRSDICRLNGNLYFLSLASRPYPDLQLLALMLQISMST